MNRDFSWGPSFLQCPYCGALATAYRNSNESLKATCETPGCETEMLWTNKGRRHKRIDYFVKGSHSNPIETEESDNRIVSLRMMSEYTKKNKETGIEESGVEMRQAL